MTAGLDQLLGGNIKREMLVTLNIETGNAVSALSTVDTELDTLKQPIKLDIQANNAQISSITTKPDYHYYPSMPGWDKLLAGDVTRTMSVDIDFANSNNAISTISDIEQQLDTLKQPVDLDIQANSIREITVIPTIPRTGYIPTGPYGLEGLLNGDITREMLVNIDFEATNAVSTITGIEEQLDVIKEPIDLNIVAPELPTLDALTEPVAIDVPDQVVTVKSEASVSPVQVQIDITADQNTKEAEGIDLAQLSKDLSKEISTQVNTSLNKTLDSRQTIAQISRNLTSLTR
jgi:hypothetical protein